MRFHFVILSIVIGLWLRVESARAQFVTIPDANFVSWLQNNGYAGCMSGNQLDTTCNDVISETGVYCWYADIEDLYGIQFFDNLDTLMCHDNQLSSLPPLPPLLYIDFGGNAFTTLPAVPASVTVLSFSGNAITNVSSLPPGLVELYCHTTLLSTLPPLPSTLKKLQCDNNFLTTLPALPQGFTELLCNNNQLSALPSLPSSLVWLECSNNNLTQLPALPTGLQDLFCNYNQLTSLPALPASLDYFECAYNQLTALPAIPASYQYLACNDNLLTSLPPLPNTMWLFRVANNPSLACMPPLALFTGNPNNFDISNTAINCLPNVIQHSGFIPAIDTMPLCGPGNPSGCAFVASCDAPISSVATANVTTSSATTTWWSNSAALKYRVRIKNMATGQTSLYFVTAPDTTKTFTGLAPNTLYKVQVRSQCSTNGSVLSPWSSAVYFTTQSLPPGSCLPPSNVAGVPTSGNTAIITWNIVTGAAGYQLRRRAQGTTTWTPLVINDGMVNAANISGLQATTTYEFQIRTKCVASPLTWSNYTSVQTFTTPLRLGENEMRTNIEVYPNPSNGNVTFNSNGSVGTLTVYDAVGRTILHQGVSSSQTTLTDLPNGFLTYRFLTADGMALNGKIVVTK